MQDFRDALRALRATPGISAVAILSLALGVGANTAIFSLINSLMLRSLPVTEPERLVYLDDGAWTNPIWEQVRGRQTELAESATAYSGQQFDLSSGGEAQFVEGLWVSGSFFSVLGVPPILGRTLTLDDDRRGGGPDGPVTVISHRFWQQRFNGSGNVLGQSISLNRVPYTIVGVTGPGFFGPQVGETFDVIVPLGTEPLVRGEGSGLDQRSMWWLEIIARLKAGQTVDQATTALRNVQPRIREATLPENWRSSDLETYLKDPLTLVPAASGSPFLRARYKRPLLTLMVVVALVLLIACANIANLMLARANGRRHELSVRLALGASRFRLARQFLAESLLMSGVGAALGLAFAYWASRLIVHQMSAGREGLFVDLAIDWRILGFTAFVAIGTAVVFGLAPALRASRVAPNDALKEQGRAMAGESHRSLGSSLVVAQVALSLVLVVAAGLFVRTFTTLANRDLGFTFEPLLVVSLDAERSKTPEGQRPALFERLAQAVASVPGIEKSAVSAVTPVSGMLWNDRFEFPELPALSQRDRAMNINFVSPGWFATYGTSILSGRDFDSRDRAGAPGVAIVNEAYVARFIKAGANPLEQLVRPQARGNQSAPPPLQIVGVVRNSVYRSVRDSNGPIVYRAMAQADEFPPFVSATARSTSGSAALLTKSITTAIGQVDPDLSLTFRPLAQQIRGSLAQERVIAILSGFFGALALLLAGIGLYGVTSYAVSRRRTEIGIRMALGADANGVVRLVLARVAILVGIGVIVGTGISIWASRFVDTLLYGLEPRDPLTFVGAVAVLGTIGALAGWLPARRAARIDPAEALRQG